LRTRKRIYPLRFYGKDSFWSRSLSPRDNHPQTREFGYNNGLITIFSIWSLLMNSPSGFIPINFRLAGNILLLLAASGFTLFVLDRIFDLSFVPASVLPASAVYFLISFYLVSIAADRK
jgi:hypothetical protein